MRVDETASSDVVKRLCRAEAADRGVIAMLEEGRDCADVVMQLAAVSRALDRANIKIIASGLLQCQYRNPKTAKAGRRRGEGGAAVPVARVRTPGGGG